MSKENNIQDLLHDVADAIREKKGTNDLINPQDFSEEIRGIQSGGGSKFNADIEFADESMFGQFGWRKVTIHEGVTTISDYCFYNNKVVEEVNFPNTLEEIGGYAFQSSTIRTAVIPDNVRTIGRYAFGSCINILNVTLPRHLETVGYGAFYGDYNIRGTLTFGENVKSIDKQAFTNCSRITCYDFRKCLTIPTLTSSDCFSISLSFSIVVPDNLYDEWIVATNWSSFVAKIVKASEYVEPTQE